MLKKIAVLLMGVLFLTGCGANIRQEGNKIYTDLSKDKVYAFATTAVQDKGYTITVEDEENYTFTSMPEDNEILGQVEVEDKSVQTNVTDGERNNETVVTVLAMINGNVDQESSEEIAREAVAEIIAELNRYGKFNSQKTAEHSYAIATPEKVNEFIEDYLVLNGMIYEGADNGFNAREDRSNNQFNEPLAARIAVEAEETGRVTVRLGAAVQGNYDVNGNQTYVDGFVARFVDYLDSYPVVEKGVRHTYRYISMDKAFANARAAITAAGYTVTEADAQNYVISAEKNNLKLALTFTQINNSIAVNVESYIEANAGETKDQLNENVTEELFTVSEYLASYQTTLTSEKTFLSSNQNEVVNSVRNALASVGYTYNFNSEEYTFTAADKVDTNKAHFLTINNLGSNGITVQIDTMYNTRSATAEATVRAENNKLLRALGNLETLK